MMRALYTFLVCAAGCALEASPPMESDTQAILGGQIEPGHPAVGLLEFSTGNFGTGTLIAPNVVLTAGHVVRGNIQGFYLGDGLPIGRGPDTTASATMRKIALATDGASVDKIVHPSYECDAQGRDAGPECAEWERSIDVGLVFLAEPVTDITPVRFGTSEPQEGALCLAVGFGDYVEDWDAADAAPTVKQKRSATSTIRKVRATELETVWESGIPDSGDSGGPLFCEDAHGLSALLGTTAYHRDGEGPKHTREWFMRTDVVMPWIEAELRARGVSWPPPANAAPIADAGVTTGAEPTPSAPREKEEDGGCNASGAPPGLGALLAFCMLLRKRRER